MGLVSKTAKVKWHPSNKKHFESLGYVYTKMGGEFEVRVEDLIEGSHVKVDCLCDNCKKPLIWKYCKYIIYNKNGKTYCRGCATKLYGTKKMKKTKLKNGKSFYDGCIESNRQDLLDRWDEELNGCSPKEVSYYTNKKMWFKCGRHPEHGSELKNINNFTSGHEGSMDCKKCNSIGQCIIDNYREEFLWKIWSDKNDISPFEVSIHSGKKVWWNCPDDKHDSFKRSCAKSMRFEFRCPECVKEKEESIIEEKTKAYLKESGYKVKTERNCTIKPTNPKTGYLLPFDNEIVLKNEKHLIIEVHGRQHYDYRYYMTRMKITKEEAEEELHYQQYKDGHKKDYCIQMGYEYLEIPYTTFDKNDTYKNLIDNKIEEILNLNKKNMEK